MEWRFVARALRALAFAFARSLPRVLTRFVVRGVGVVTTVDAGAVMTGSGFGSIAGVAGAAVGSASVQAGSGAR